MQNQPKDDEPKSTAATDWAMSLGNDDDEHILRQQSDILSEEALKVQFVSDKEPLSSLAAEYESGSPILLQKIKVLEVSGKHAMINWNENKIKWELVDMGSLNGTLLNSNPINHPDSGSRRWGDPFDLSSGDTITLGTTSNLSVRISSQTESQIPFSIGVASDPMALCRGGRKLPMEDMCYYQWLLPSADQFGLFGICDGHGGAAAAKTASKVGYLWMTRLLALSFYAMLLMPGFIQVAYYYFFSSHVCRSIVYGDQPRNRLDLHLPANSNGSKPVVAFVTGGAWIIGS